MKWQKHQEKVIALLACIIFPVRTMHGAICKILREFEPGVTMYEQRFPDNGGRVKSLMRQPPRATTQQTSVFTEGSMPSRSHQEVQAQGVAAVPPQSSFDNVPIPPAAPSFPSGVAAGPTLSSTMRQPQSVTSQQTTVFTEGSMPSRSEHELQAQGGMLEPFSLSSVDSNNHSSRTIPAGVCVGTRVCGFHPCFLHRWTLIDGHTHTPTHSQLLHTAANDTSRKRNQAVQAQQEVRNGVCQHASV